jgi:hypothetical protein
MNMYIIRKTDNIMVNVNIWHQAIDIHLKMRDVSFTAYAIHLEHIRKRSDTCRKLQLRVQVKAK